MSKKLFIDCSSGVSGDMVLGAFLSLGVPAKTLINGLESLGLNEFELKIKEVSCAEISAIDVDVVLHDKSRALVHPYSGEYRNYGQIKEIIGKGNISLGAKELSTKIFNIKASAEAKVHGVPIDNVKFHEAGAIDSIVDIVGCAICFDSLNISQVISKIVPTGYGTVMCACGELPVPAPAVCEILKKEGIPHYRSNTKQELLTPTGAAILAALVDIYDDKFKIQKNFTCGYGTGKRDTNLKPLCFILEDDKSETEVIC